jgi:hypothetical protein
MLIGKSLRTALLLLAASVPAVTNAGIIFSEDFELASGNSLLAGGDPVFGSTEREGGAYYQNVSVPGWSLGNSSNTFVHEGSSQNTSVLLNGGGSTSLFRTISGLTVGIAHELAFEYWGDNESFSNHLLRIEFLVNGTLQVVTRNTTGLNTGNFGTVSYTFTPTQATTVLRFAELNGSGAHLDNIVISNAITVPEPGVLAMFGLALLAAGFGLFGRRVPKDTSAAV